MPRIRTARTRNEERRRGVVLLAVLIVIVLLSLAAYQYSALMVAEYQASENFHQAAQARALADSGIHYAAALLSNPENIANLLNNNIYDNPDVFQSVSVQAQDKQDRKGPAGYFALVAPPDGISGDATQWRYGVTDEAGRININAVMKRDPTGQQLYDMLVKLPNMTTAIAAAIVDWVDVDSDTRPGGAEDEYYAGLAPPYHCKNGPLDSVEELLLVQGVTPELLYGNDLNRSGAQDAGEAESGAFDRGWSAFLTIHSREQNTDALGAPPVNINQEDLADLYGLKLGLIDDDLAKFIVLYRQYGSSTSSGQITVDAGSGRITLNLTIPSQSSQKYKTGKLANFNPDFTRKGDKKIASFFDLVEAKVTVPDKNPKNPPTVYTSPLKDIGQQRDLLPTLFLAASVFAESEIPARVNVNTAPQEVLATLPELTEAQVQAILVQRPKSSDPPSEVYQTPAWLLTEAGIKASTLSKLEKVITTRTQVYRVQSLGFFEGYKGQSARVEAVIDTNAGRPRILAWRDLTELGRGGAGVMGN